MIEVLDKIRQAGGTVEVVGGDLRLRLPKGLLSAAERSILAEHKAELVRLLAVCPDLDDDEEEIIPPPPCRQCGGFMLWQDFSGSWHCMDCTPADRSEKLRRQAERLRKQARNNRP
jgi:hypothetical protein